MNKILLLITSIFEIFRWMLIYFFLNSLKTVIDPNNTILLENLLWFGSVVFVNLLFAVSGFLSFINYKKYSVMLEFWYVFKLFFISFTIILLLQGVVSIKTYFLTFAPFDFLIFLQLLFLTKSTKE